eukprot:scaffold77501_cov86-Phaeocystis_antarctica.AAC.1
MPHTQKRGHGTRGTVWHLHRNLDGGSNEELFRPGLVDGSSQRIGKVKALRRYTSHLGVIGVEMHVAEFENVSTTTCSLSGQWECGPAGIDAISIVVATL